MSQPLHYTLLITSLLLGVVFFSSQGFADGVIIYQEDAVEADKIEVFIPKGSQTGNARVTGCNGCPMTLSIDGATGFFFQNKPANAKRVAFLSGKSGTVIFDEAQQRVLRILW